MLPPPPPKKKLSKFRKWIIKTLREIANRIEK